MRSPAGFLGGRERILPVYIREDREMGSFGVARGLDAPGFFLRLAVLRDGLVNCNGEEVTACNRGKSKWRTAWDKKGSQRLCALPG